MFKFKQNSNIPTPTLKKRLQNVGIGLLIILMVVLVAGHFLFGYARYYGNYVRCGKKPLEYGMFGQIAKNYNQKYVTDYSISSFNIYACDEQEIGDVNNTT